MAMKNATSSCLLGRAAIEQSNIAMINVYLELQINEHHMLLFTLHVMNYVALWRRPPPLPQMVASHRPIIAQTPASLLLPL